MKTAVKTVILCLSSFDFFEILKKFDDYKIEIKKTAEKKYKKIIKSL